MAKSAPNGEFLETAVLDTLVPAASHSDIAEVLASATQDEGGIPTSLLPSVEQRSLLFFDELVAVYVVLRVSNVSETALKAYLSGLSIRLDAFAISGHDAEAQESQGANDNSPRERDLIYSGEVQDTTDPLIMVHEADPDAQNGSEGGVPHMFVLWKANAFLNRPRVRLQNPSVIFVASALLRAGQDDATPQDGDDFLPSLKPASVNLLEPLQAHPALKNSDLQLPASRLTSILPMTKSEESFASIRHNPPRAIRVIAAVSARVRYSRLNTYSTRPTTVASLDFEVTPYVDYDVVLEKADLMLYDGRVEDMTGTAGLKPPIVCRPKDDITFLYKLFPENGPELSTSTTALVGVLDIFLGAKLTVSDACQPRISMRWRTNVDFSMPLNPVFGGPSQGLQRNKRPASLPMTPLAAGSSSGISTPVSRPPPRERAFSTSDQGVTISFSGPPTVVVGKVFHWSIFVLNNSLKPRKFAIVAIASRKRTESRRHATKPSTSSSDGQRDNSVAEAIADENIVYAMQKSAVPNDTDLVSINTDIRVGPLAPGSCHETEMRLLPLAAGPLRLEAVRIVDVSTNETTDIRDLPDIVAVEMQDEAS